MEEPQEAFLEASGKDSGTMNIMNIRLNAVIIVAKMMTWTWPLVKLESRYVPRAGLMTKLAAKVADTCVCACVCVCVCACVCV